MIPPIAGERWRRDEVDYGEQFYATPPTGGG
jgi:hypothetical protein